jgi:actin-related protein
MSDIEFSQLTTQTNTQETPIKMSSQSFTLSAAFLKAVEKEMKSYVTTLSKAGALNCSVKVAMEALLSGREIEQPVKAKKPKISEEEKAIKKEAAEKLKAEKAAKKEAALKLKEEKKTLKDAEKVAKKEAALKLKEEKKVLKEEMKALKEAEKARLKEEKKALKDAEKAAKNEATLKLKEEKKALKDAEKAKLKQEKDAKKEAAKTLKSLKKVQMPFLAANDDASVCKAVTKNGGLYTQCVKNSCSDDGDFCTKCLKDVESSPDNKPKYGHIDDRVIGGFKEGTAPVGFEKSTGYTNFADYLVKKNIAMADAQAYATASGLNWDEFPEEYLKCAPKKKRGRKPNSPAADDSDEETNKKKRGRPTKVARSVTPTAELLSNMVDEEKVGDVSENDDDGIEATPFQHSSMPGLSMAIDNENNVYNTENGELLGKYNPENDAIDYASSSDEEDDELSEEDISDIDM